MNQKNTRLIVIITALVTAFIHLVLLNIFLGKIDVPFTLNGLGYLALLAAFLYRPAFLSGRTAYLYLAFIGFTVVTILAWFFLGDLNDPLGIVTKVDEALLILALVLHWRRESN